MVKHRWHKEIKAWADGAEIEVKENGGGWWTIANPTWREIAEYRIKRQPKAEYLCVFMTDDGIELAKFGQFTRVKRLNASYELIGKIKLEVDDD